MDRINLAGNNPSPFARTSVPFRKQSTLPVPTVSLNVANLRLRTTTGMGGLPIQEGKGVLRDAILNAGVLQSTQPMNMNSGISGGHQPMNSGISGGYNMDAGISGGGRTTR